MSEPKVTKQDILNASSQMLNKDLYVVFTKPTKGLGPVMENIEEHLKFQVSLEEKGIMFGAGPFWEDNEIDWAGEGMVIIGKMSDKIPESVRKEAQDLADGIASGDIHSFTGPINKQDGTPWLAAGETADIGTLLGMNFYVEGIEGDIPQ